MIANLIGGFIAILVGVSLIGPVSTEINAVTFPGAAEVLNQTNSSVVDVPAIPAAALYATSSWGSTVLKLVPGFFALGVMGIGIAVTYSALKESNIV